MYKHMLIVMYGPVQSNLVLFMHYVSQIITMYVRYQLIIAIYVQYQ